MSDWKRLYDGYGKEGLVLFLGAGASYASGLPGWEELIRRLMKRSLTEADGSEIFETLRTEGYSLPTITEFLEKKEDSEEQFTEMLREELYKDFPCKNIQDPYDPESANSLVEHMNQKNKTLAEVYNLSVLCEDGGLKPNTKIHNIISFNLDSLLEAYDAARNAVHNKGGKRRCLHTIENPAAGRIPGRISVYHPHGYLRFDKGAGSERKEESKSKILSESEFFDFYNRATDIFTYSLLYNFREFHCLFVGMSLSDDNVRRLLFYSKRERDECRARVGRKPDEYPRHFAIMQEKETTASDFQSRTLRSLGVQTLWVKPGEVAEKIKELRLSYREG